MQINRIRWGLALGGVLTAEATLVAAAFAWVAVYSYLLHPGGSREFYQQYALKSSPWVSLTLGIPVFFLVCRWIASRSPAPTAMAVFGIFLLIDAPLTLAGVNSAVSPWFLAANYLAKFVACYLGGRTRSANS